MPDRWRVGRTIPINVYDGEIPVCQCQTADYARRIVDAVNTCRPQPWLQIQLQDMAIGGRPYNCLHFIVGLENDSTMEEILRIERPHFIKNFGKHSFLDVVGGCISCGAEFEYIRNSNFVRTSPPSWREKALELHVGQEQPA